MKPRKRKGDARRLQASELLAQEYASLRNESLAAKQNQQTILQWTLATVGVVVAASIAAAATLKDLDTFDRFGLGLASAGLVGVLMPVVVSCAFGIWIGELQRMERAGRYLRAKEFAWSRGASEKADPSDPRYGFVLLWESLLVDETRSDGYPKNRLGGAASVGLFLALSIFSLLGGVAVAIGPGGILANRPPDLSPSTVFWVVGVWVTVFLAANIVAFYKPVLELAASTATKKSATAARSRTAKARV